MSTVKTNETNLSKKIFTSLIAGKPINFGKVKVGTNEERTLLSLLLKYGYVKLWGTECNFNREPVNLYVVEKEFSFRPVFEDIEGTPPSVIECDCNPGNFITFTVKNEKTN